MIFVFCVLVLLKGATCQFRIDFDPRFVLPNLTLIAPLTTTTTTTSAPGTPMPTPAPPPPPELFLLGVDGALNRGFYPGQLVRFRLQSAAPLVLYSQHFVRLFFGGFEAPIFFAGDVPMTT
jgi:hypothetical protein